MNSEQLSYEQHLARVQQAVDGLAAQIGFHAATISVDKALRDVEAIAELELSWIDRNDLSDDLTAIGRAWRSMARTTQALGAEIARLRADNAAAAESSPAGPPDLTDLPVRCYVNLAGPATVHAAIEWAGDNFHDVARVVRELAGDGYEIERHEGMAETDLCLHDREAETVPDGEACIRDLGPGTWLVFPLTRRGTCSIHRGGPFADRYVEITKAAA